jgi:hypothetical protein
MIAAGDIGPADLHFANVFAVPRLLALFAHNAHVHHGHRNAGGRPQTEYPVLARILEFRLKEVADNWIRRYVNEEKPISADELKRQLDRYIYSKWKDRMLLDIRRSDVTAPLDTIADRHGKRQADAVLGTIRRREAQIIRWNRTHVPWP